MDFALAAGVKRLALFHHDPLRDDAALDQLEEACRRRAVAGGLDVFAAAEGQTIELAEREAVTPRATRQPEAAAKGVAVTLATILLVDDDPDIVRLLNMTLRPEGYRLLSASDGNAALEIARAERPDLLLLDWNMPGRNGLEVCRALRAESDTGPSRRARGAPDRAGGGRGHCGGICGRGHRLRDQAIQAGTRPASRVHIWLRRKRTGAEGT